MEGFLTTPRADPNSALVSRGSKWILKEKLFNIQQLLQCRSKYYETNLWHPYSSRVFEQYQECNKRRCGLGDLNVINNQNKQTTFLYKTTFSKPWSFGPFDLYFYSRRTSFWFLDLWFFTHRHDLFSLANFCAVATIYLGFFFMFLA